MSAQTIDQDISKLAHFIESKHFEPVTQRTPYFHMGATITDAVLQAGLNYRNVVYPRVIKLLTAFSDYQTTCDFIILMQTVPLSELIDLKNKRKLSLIKQISWFFFDNGVENENELARWFVKFDNCMALLDFNGVGPKTLDYLKMLCGYQSIAIDRHLFNFLRLANVFVDSYQEAKCIYQQTAKMLNMTHYELDRKIWLYMSSKKA